MADGPDRREARRFTMSLPMRVLPRDSQTREFQAHTRDDSYRGQYFHAEGQFEVGTQIEFVLSLPQRISETGDVDIRCRGQIVRVESSSNGYLGVAARIDRYEFMPATATAA